MNTINIRCRNCGFEKDFYFGTGLIHAADCDMDAEDALLPRLIKDEDKIRRLKAMLEQEGGALVSDYQFGLFQCAACGAFYKRFVYHVTFEDGHCYEPAYTCECGGKLEALDLEQLDLSEIACPDCGQKTLYEGMSDFGI